MWTRDRGATKRAAAGNKQTHRLTFADAPSPSRALSPTVAATAARLASPPPRSLLGHQSRACARPLQHGAVWRRMCSRIFARLRVSNGAILPLAAAIGAAAHERRAVGRLHALQMSARFRGNATAALFATRRRTSSADHECRQTSAPTAYGRDASSSGVLTTIRSLKNASNSQFIHRRQIGARDQKLRRRRFFADNA